MLSILAGCGIASRTWQLLKDNSFFHPSAELFLSRSSILNFLQVPGKEFIYPLQCHWLWGCPTRVPPQGCVRALSTQAEIFHFNWFSSTTKGLRSLSPFRRKQITKPFFSWIFPFVFFFSHFFKKIEDICLFFDKLLFPQAALWCFGAFHLIDICYCCMCVFISASSATWGAIECWTTRSALSS